VSVGATDPNDRGTLAAVATGTALAGGIVKGLVFDRPRIALSLPNAREQGKVGKWALELLGGQATNDIVPISGGTVTIAGRTLTKDAWKHAYRASNALTLGLVGVTMLYGIPNLVDGYQQGDGFGGIMESRAGRTGVLASIGGLVELGLFSYAAMRSGGGSSGRLVSALHHSVYSSGATVLARVALGTPVMLNEMGFMDFLNRGDDRGIVETGRDTIAGHVETGRTMWEQLTG
jgi:hypothetical protein